MRVLHTRSHPCWRRALIEHLGERQAFPDRHVPAPSGLEVDPAESGLVAVGGQLGGTSRPKPSNHSNVSADCRQKLLTRPGCNCHRLRSM